MPLGLGWAELLIVAVVVLVVFGPKKLPEIGRSLGRGARELKESVGVGDLKDSVTGILDEDVSEAPQRKPKTAAAPSDRDAGS
jgi:sec-independent protein translocase protein TatA